MKDLTGKKILVIHRKYVKVQCFVGVIVGCEPEIGICVAKPGKEKDPWFIYDGPLSPDFEKCIWNKEEAILINNFCLNQLKSGYLSLYAIDQFVSSIGAIATSKGLTDAICPYSM